MKSSTHLRAAGERLLRALEGPSRDAPRQLFMEIQLLIKANRPMLDSAFPGTRDFLDQVVTFSIADYPVDCSQIDTPTLRRRLERKMPGTWKAFAELLAGIVEELVIYRVPRKCLDCGAPAMECLYDPTACGVVYHCAECDAAQQDDGREWQGTALLRVATSAELSACGILG